MLFFNIETKRVLRILPQHLAFNLLCTCHSFTNWKIEAKAKAALETKKRERRIKMLMTWREILAFFFGLSSAFFISVPQALYGGCHVIRDIVAGARFLIGKCFSLKKTAAAEAFSAPSRLVISKYLLHVFCFSLRRFSGSSEAEG